MKPRAALQLVRDAARDFSRDDALTHGASLAFYTALSLGPLVVVFLSLADAIGGGVRDSFLEEAKGMVGPSGGAALEEIVEGADESLDARRLPLAVAIGAAAFSATAVFAKLQQSLNKVWNVKAEPGWNLWRWVRKRLMTFAMLAGVGFLLLVSLVVSAGLSMLFTQDAWIWRATELVVSLGVYTTLFMLVFRILPDVKIAWRETWIGAAVTAVLFAAGKWAISAYLGTVGVGKQYGAAGSLLALLVWVYWSSVIVLLGAEITQAYVKERREVRTKGPARKQVHPPAKRHATVHGA